MSRIKETPPPWRTLGAEREGLEALPRLTLPLLAWYDRERRAMPWRDDPQPYHVWVSEIMLQQTRVEAVREHYARFLAALPTVRHLAEAEEDALLKLWEGLGYYNRARNLQKAARILLAEHGGRLPASCDGLRALPGIGEYTAGAIASIAFGIPVPAVDGNVYRVLSRVLASRADISLPAVKGAFRQAAASMIPADRPGDFNQALMELGATVCLPGGAPLCVRCPVANACAGRQAGIAEQLPVLPAKKARRIEARTVALIWSGDALLLWRRSGKGLLHGMYEPLNLEGHLSPEEVAAAIRRLGGEPRRIVPLPDTKHIFSHVEWRMRGYRAECAPFPVREGVWADRAQLAGEYALPSAFRDALSVGIPPR